MGDGMDPCECIWSHELAMRRLLSVIRNSQATCTDNECFEDGFREGEAPMSNALMISMMIVAAMVLYLFRPRSQRINGDVIKPTTNGNNGNNGAPPSPPSDVL